MPPASSTRAALSGPHPTRKRPPQGGSHGRACSAQKSNDPDADGKKFIRFLSREGDKNSIGGNYIYRLTHDREGNIWVSADGSLNKIDKKSGKITGYTLDQSNANSLSSDIITKVFF